MYYVRDGNWGFSNYEFTVQIPWFPRGGDYVIVAYDPSDTSNNKIIYEHILELVDEYYGYNLRDNGGWPNCLSADDCHYWVRDMDGFNTYASQATDDQSGYTVGSFSTDISGWTEAAIGVLKADCSDTSDYQTCDNFEMVTTNWQGLDAAWYLYDAHIQHTDTEVTFHFTLKVYEFAREGNYLIVAYDTSDPDTYELYPEVIELQDVGLYGYNFAGVDDSPVCPVDEGCVLFTPSDAQFTTYAFQLLEKQYATAYPGEAVYGSFSAVEAANFDSRFGVSFVLVPGVCYGNDLDNCNWNDDSQLEILSRDLLYTPSTETYEWLAYIPDSVQAGSHYLLAIYGYDHWNMNVQESLPGIVVSIESHPIPDGTNLYHMYGAPNCEGDDCTFYTSYTDFMDLLLDQDSTKREKYWYFSTNMFDNLWTEYAFAGVYAECGDINNFATCSYDVNDLAEWTLEAVTITEDSMTEYYEAMMRIPILGLPHGDYVLIRFDPS